MHIEVPASEPLVTLDNFLRDVWVECCDHLSAFRIDGELYEDERELGDLSFFPGALEYEEGEGVAGEDSEEKVEEDDDEEGYEEDIDEEEEEDDEEYEDLSPEEMAEAVGELLDLYAEGGASVPLPAELEAELRKPRSRDDLVAFLKEKLKEQPNKTYRYSLTDREEQRRLYFQEHILKVLLDMVEDRSLDVPLEKVLQVGQKFTYDYDFGSTTRLNLRVILEREGVLSQEEEDDDVTILARNVAPAMLCCKCGKPATQVAAGYYYVEENAYCDKCAENSEYPDMMLPIVNSPRVGVCGYTGDFEYEEDEEYDEEDEDDENIE
jgi:hypothetical protein